MTALALVASVLVAVPAAAADDPEPSYTATFDACAGAPSSGFDDVPAGHANAGDIDCIAYYGITKGTSATTYSPLMSVTREHMALFLTRLAALVGIEVTSTPDDPGFTDIGDLSDNSQNAIAQLADLGITKGTSDTTYSPGDSVERGHMALFIARLMNQMDPMEVEGTAYGKIPEDVVDVDDDDSTMDDETVEVGSPFTDLGSATKSAYDAITQLYELGVATGISGTAYGPSALITRASMASFMAAVLDHSNARPAGLSMQAVTSSKFGDISTEIVVSYRDDSFAPMSDLSINYFYTGNATSAEADAESAGALNEDNACADADDCTDNQELTDDSGNFPIAGDVANGNSNTYYAWMSDDDNEEFDADDVAYASVTLSSDEDATHFGVESDIDENADANTVDVDVTDSVTFTVQLTDGQDGDDVAKSGVTVSITFVRAVDENENGTADEGEVTRRMTEPMETDDNGQVSYSVSAPSTDDDDDDDDVLDEITFTSTGLTGPDDASEIAWKDDAPGTPNKTTIDVPDYAVTYLDGTTAEVDGSATVTLYDMYGNTAGRGLRVTVEIDDTAGDPVGVNSRGQAKFSRSGIAAAGNETISVDITQITEKGETTNMLGAGDNPIADSDNGTIPVVGTAADDTPASNVMVEEVFADEDKFRGNDDNLYSYDSDDTFIDADGKIIDLDKFESTAEDETVDVLVYDDDGSSIFRIQGE